MTVKRKISPSMEKFIDKGAEVKASKNNEFKNILVRIPISILDKLDKLVEMTPWRNRTQWIIGILDEALKGDSNEGSI